MSQKSQQITIFPQPWPASFLLQKSNHRQRSGHEPWTMLLQPWTLYVCHPPYNNTATAAWPDKNKNNNSSLQCNSGNNLGTQTHLQAPVFLTSTLSIRLNNWGVWKQCSGRSNYCTFSKKYTWANTISVIPQPSTYHFHKLQTLFAARKQKAFQ